MASAELVQLAATWNFVDIPAGGMMAEQKIDGWRAIFIRNWKRVAGLYTRNGQEIDGVGHIIHKLDLMELIAGERMVFDGEYQVNGTLSDTKRWCERLGRRGGEAGTLHLFDCMPEAEWQRGGSDTPLYQRKARLAELMAAADAHPLSWEWRPGSRGNEPEGPAVVILRDEWVADRAAALDLAQRTWAAGGEGIMLKDAESPYQRKRAPFWLKVKTPAYKAA